MHHVEDIHELSLVFMETLGHHLVDGVVGDLEPVTPLSHPLLQSFFVNTPHFHPFLLELFILCQVGQVGKEVEICEPLLFAAHAFCEQVGERTICIVDPATRRDPVRLVDELLRVVGIEVREQISLEELGVKRCHSIDLVAAYDREIGHSDLLGLALLNNAHIGELVDLAWEVLLNAL